MSLGGFQSVVSKHLVGFKGVPGCTETHWTYDMGFGCDARIRRLNLWSTNLSIVRIAGLGYQQQPDWAYPVHGMNAGMLSFEMAEGSVNGGYAAPVIVGGNYTLTGEWRGDVTPEFSDPELQQVFGDEALTVSFEASHITATGHDRACELKSSEPRLFMGSYGPAQGMPSPARCAITQPAETTTAPDTGGNIGKDTCKGRQNGTCFFPSTPQIGFYWDPCCYFGKLGCHADAVNIECRFCGNGPWSSVSCPSTTTTTTAEAAFRYKLITSGACHDLGLDPVKNEAACQAAAQELGLEATSVTAIQRPDRPEWCYWHSSSSLWLNSDPSAAGNGAQVNVSAGNRYPICEVRRFRVITTGTCGGIGWFPITSLQRCEEAGKALGIVDTSATATDLSDRPEGCYLFQGVYLWFGRSPDSKGKGAETSEPGLSRHPICTPSASSLLEISPQGLLQ